MRKKIIISIIILILLRIYLFSNNESLDLDVDTAVNLALANSLDIKIEKFNLEETKWALISSWNTFIPTFTFDSYLIKYNQEVIQDAKNEIDQSYEDSDLPFTNDMYDSIVKGSVYTNFKLTFNFNVQMIFEINKSLINWQQNKISLDIVKGQIKRNIKGFYYNLIVLKENIDLIKTNIDDAKKRFDLAKKKYEQELISELDLLSSEFTYENLKPQYIDMINKYEDVIAVFKQIIGVKEDVIVNLIDNFDMIGEYGFTLHKELISSIGNNLEIKLHKENLKSLINQRNSYIALLTPTFSLSYLFDFTFNKNDPFDKDSNWFQDIEKDWVQKTGNITLMFSVPISVFMPFSKEQMRIVYKSLEIKKEKTKIEKLRDDKVIKLKEYLRSLEKFSVEYNALILNKKIAEKVYTLAKASYEADIKDLQEVETAEEKLNDAKLSILKAKYNYILNILDLELLLNNNIIK